MKKRTRLLALLLMLSMLLPILPMTSLIAWANEIASNSGEADAMEAIKNDAVISACAQGETQAFENDGYIGIPYEVTVYYDSATHGNAKAGFMTLGATPVIVYVVNTNTARVGTDSDVSIIRSMLERGYAVAVVDYLNSEKAQSPALDWSASKLRNKAKAGDFFKSANVFESGAYQDTLVVPAGDNVRLNDVYFELDKHGVDGTLEEIVKLWNNDFRGTKSSKIVKWVRPDGTRKTTQLAPDGSSPVWYADAAGTTVDNANGQYTKVGYTKAETITDCVKADGTPIDLNLYMHTVYPTSPLKKAPAVILYSSSASLSAALNAEDRPQFMGFLFNGYAGAIAEYAWIPMARSDHYDSFSGDIAGGVTGVNMTYATYTYNATQSGSAAARFLRYLALSEEDTYAIDVDHFGAYGISKTAWYTQLGAPVLCKDLITKADGLSDAEVAEAVNDKVNSFVQLLLPAQCSGRSRYDNGDTADVTVDGFTVDGGELQPWAVYDGNEIASGVQANYSSCGAFLDYFCEGYAPQFITANLADNYSTEYGQQNIMINLCRTMNIPALWFEADIAHTFTKGFDANHGVDIYDAFFRFMGYYLKGEPVSVSYTTPANGGVIRTTDAITLKFVGEVTASEIQKVTVKDASSNVLTGTWTSAYGNSEWTFLADSMKGNTAYTLTVPADMKGENGVAIGVPYVTSFHTRSEGDVTTLASSVTLDENGSSVLLTVPEKTADGYKLRVNVKNEAANTLYAYNAQNNDLMGSVRVSGTGFWEIDVTDYLASYEVGAQVSVLLKTAKTESTEPHFEQTFDSDDGGFSYVFSDTTVGVDIDGEKALKIVRVPESKSGEYSVYPNMEGSYTLTSKKVIKDGAAVGKSDLGRTFLITVRVYDTVSRPVRIFMNSGTQKATQRIDYDRVYYNFFTKANEWSEFTVPYTVYEMRYAWNTQVKDLFVQFTPLGGQDENPIYLDNIKAVEQFTDVEAATVSLVSASDSGFGVKAPTGTKPFKVGSTEYDSWKSAINAAASGATVTLQSNCTLTNSDLVSFAAKSHLVIDLNGYRLTSANTYDAPLWASATNANTLNVTMKNGSVVLSDTALIGYGGSTTAGNNKIINVSLENLYVTVAKDATTLNIFSTRTLPNATGVVSNVHFTDCVLDVERENLPAKRLNGLAYFPKGDAALSVNYSFTGSRIVANTFHDALFSESVFDALPNASGEYLQLLLPSSAAAPTTPFRKGSDYAFFKSSSTENGYVVYDVETAEHSTEYGAIPEAYADREKYPFAIFMDEAFLAGAENWITTNTTVKETLAKFPGATVNVLLRDDYTSETYIGNANWLCFMNGTFVLDLGGNTMLSSQSLFEAGVDSSYTGSYDTAFTVKNGTVLIGGGNVCAAQQSSNYQKKMDLLFENVTFGLDETFTTNRNKLFLAWNNTKVQAVLDLNLTLKNCTFDLRGIPCDFTVFAYGGSTHSVAADVRVIGGKILTDSTVGNITWYSADSTGAADSLIFEKGSDGKYITMSVVNGTTPKASFPTSEGYFGFGELVSDGEDFDVYTLKNDTTASPYGSIPATYADSTFVLFTGGKCIGGVSLWKDALTLTRETLNANPGTQVQILMQKSRDVASYVGNANWLCYMNGSILLDMNGNTLTSKTTSLFELGMDANYNGNYKTTLTVKNGTVLQGGGNVCGIQNNSTYAKEFDVTFENVDFGIHPTAFNGTRSTLFYAQTNCKANVDVSLTFEDCDIDVSAITIDYTVFSFASSDAYVSADIAFNGGSFKVPSFENVTLMTLDTANDTFVWGKGSGGAYATLTLPADYTLSETVSGVTASGTYVSFGNGTVSGDCKIYTLEENPLVTKYGNIPQSAADAAAYPFVLFDANKNYVNALAAWGNAITAATNYLSSRKGQTVYVLMRQDHDAGSSSAAHLGLLVGTIEVDLGGRTLTRNANSLLEGGTNKMTEAQSACTATVNIRNGKILAGKSSSSSGHILTYQSHVNYNKTMNITFEDVIFGVKSGITNITSLVTRSWGASSGVTGVTTSTLKLIDCTFDFSGSAGTAVPSSTTLIHLSGSGSAQNVTVIIEGGSFVGTASGITPVNLDSSDRLIFEKNEKGKYFEYNVTAGTPPTDGFDSDLGKKMYFVKKQDGLYTLAVKAEECGNALIPYEYYEDTKNYPFIVYAEGTLVGCVANWNAAQAAAKTYLDSHAGGTVYALMRADQADSPWYPSDGVFNGTFVVDLGGYTVQRGANSFLELCTYNLTAEACAFETTIIVKNGTILAGKATNENGHILAVQSNTAYNKSFHVTFEGVTFGISALNYNLSTDKGLAAVVLRDNGRTANATGTVSVDLLLKNCIFDLTEGEKTTVPTSNTSLFNTAPSTASNEVDITIEGGLFKGTHNMVKWITAGDGSSVTFRKNSDGEYFRYDLSAGTPDLSLVTTDQGNGYFYRDAISGDYLLGIGRAEITGASVNLGKDLSLLYYVRINDPSLLNFSKLSMTFVMNGKSVTVDEYEIVNGEYVFVLSGVAPQQMADLIDASVWVDGQKITEYNGYSIKQNCLNLLSKTASQLGLSEDAYAAMKTLISDLLFYGDAAAKYTQYANSVLDGTEGITASTVLPTESDRMTMTGNTDETLYIKSGTVRFDTVNKLRIKIFAGVEHPESVTLRVNGTEYALSDLENLGGGIYQLTTDAIGATDFDTVYTFELSYEGSTYATLNYSVNAYAYSKQGSNSDAMKNLALALYRYGIAAEAYAAIN